MNSDRELTRIVESWLEEGVNVLPDRVLDHVLDRVPVTPQRRPWWRAWRNQSMNRTLKWAAAGTVAVLVAVVLLGVYFSRPAVGPIGSPTPATSPTTAVATPTPSQPPISPTPGQTQATGSDAPWILFMLNDQGFHTPNPLWAMRADGTGAREIYRPPGSCNFCILLNIAWSQDGTKLLLETEGADGTSNVLVAEVGDEIGPFVDTRFDVGADTACNEKSTEPHPCQDGDFTLAPDGQRVAFTQRCTWNPQPGCGFITILDLRTGELTELSATLQQGRHTGPISGPAWSPDGTQIAFIKETLQGQPEPADSNLWLIDADGTNQHQLDLPVARLTAPQWSPDGQLIALVSELWHDGVEPETQVDVQNIYTVRPDGTDFRQLTTDDNSSWPEWTLSGQIRFRNGHLTDQSTHYSLMDADGSNVRPLIDLAGVFDSILPEGLEWFTGDLGRSFLWQPAESWYPDP